MLASCSLRPRIVHSALGTCALKSERPITESVVFVIFERATTSGYRSQIFERYHLQIGPPSFCFVLLPIYTSTDSFRSANTNGWSPIRFEGPVRPSGARLTFHWSKRWGKCQLEVEYVKDMIGMLRLLSSARWVVESSVS